MKVLKKAFTLIELIVVITIITILSAASIGTYFGVTISANNSKCEQELKSLYNVLLSGLSSYKNTNFHWSKENDGILMSDVGRTIFYEILEESYNINNLNIYYFESYESCKNNDYDNSKSSLYLFIDNYLENYKLCYIGYLFKNFNISYIKYINVGTGEFISSFNGNYLLYDEIDCYASKFKINNDLNYINNQSFYNIFIDDGNKLEYRFYNNFLTNYSYLGKIKKIKFKINSIGEESIFISISGSKKRASSMDIYNLYDVNNDNSLYKNIINEFSVITANNFKTNVVHSLDISDLTYYFFLFESNINLKDNMNIEFVIFYEKNEVEFEDVSLNIYYFNNLVYYDPNTLMEYSGNIEKYETIGNNTYFIFDSNYRNNLINGIYFDKVDKYLNITYKFYKNILYIKYTLKNYSEEYYNFTFSVNIVFEEKLSVQLYLNYNNAH